MRPGLVIFGALFIALGAGMVAAVYLLPPASVGQQSTTTFAPAPIPAGGTVLFGPIRGTDQNPSTFSLSWQSTVPADVALWESSECTGSSPSSCSGTPLASWSARTNGTWGTTSSLGYPLTLSVTGAAASAGSFQATAVDDYRGSTTLSPLLEILIDASAGVLIAVGGVLVFLGLFLRRDVYSAPPPLVSHSADDVADLAPPPR